MTSFVDSVRWFLKKALLDLEIEADEKLVEYLMAQNLKRSQLIVGWATAQRFVREEMQRVIHAAAVFGEKMETATAIDREFPTPSAAIEWINQVSRRSQFLLGSITDKRTKLVTKVEPRPRLRIFKVDKCEWWFGVDRAAVKAAYIEYYGGDDETLRDVEDIRELTDKEIDTLKFRDENAEGHLNKRQIRFRTRLEEEKDNLEARYFCGTEW